MGMVDRAHALYYAMSSLLDYQSRLKISRVKLLLVIGWRMRWRRVDFLRMRSMVAVRMLAGMAVAGDIEPLWEAL